MTDSANTSTAAELPTPEASLHRYAERPGSIRPEPGSPVTPGPVAMSIAERLRARAEGELTADQWRTVDDSWYRCVEGRYRACVTRRPLPLEGPPIRVGVKDTVDVAGFPTTLGLRHHRHYPQRTADALADLDPRTAAVTAKVVTTELNIGVGSGCVNPYAPAIDPAGSSTGAAVAVAAGLCDLALGTDVLGSVRWPAGHCGTVGLRTTHRPSSLGGVFPLSPPMDALGWVARTAADLATATRAIDVLDHGQAPDVVGAVGVVSQAREDSSASMAAALDEGARLVESAGGPVHEVELDDLWDVRGIAWELCARQAWDAYLYWREWIDTELKESTLAALEVGAAVSDDRYREALERLVAHRAQIERRFAATGADVWLLPLDPNPPPTVAAARSVTSTIPHPDDTQRVGFTPIASFAGLPALTLPVARASVSGAPLCVQLVGRPGSDRQLIELGCALETQRADLHLSPR